MAEPRKTGVGFVRGETNRFLCLYDQVKRVSPLLQMGLEKVEKMPWNKAEPVIDVLDVRIDNLTQSVSSKVTAIQSKYQTGKAVVNEGVAKTGEKWKDLRGDLTKKAGLRIEQGLTQVREFSAHRGKDIIHFDLIQYSHDVIDGASDAVTRKLKPVYDPIARNLAASVQKANQAASQLRQSVTESVVGVSERAKLRLRLKEARCAARELSSNGIAFAQAKYGDLAARIPDSSTLHKGLQFIASSPELFQKIKNKADLDASKRVLDNLNNLLLAIRDVVFQQDHQEEILAEAVELPEQASDEESEDAEIPGHVSGAESEEPEQASHAKVAVEDPEPESDAE